MPYCRQRYERSDYRFVRNSVRGVKQNEEVIGSVIDVQNYGASDIMQIKKSNGSEILLAMCPATVLNVDLINKEITVNIPDEIEANDEN